MPDKKTKVLIVNDHIGYGNQIHGAARLFRLWAMHLDPSRYSASVCILRERTELARCFEEEGVTIRFLGKSKYDPTTLPALLRVVREEKTDLMHLQAYGGATFGRLVRMITGVPAIVHYHDTNPYYPLIQKVTDRVLRPFTEAWLAVSRVVRDLYAGRNGIDPSRITVLYNCFSYDEFQPPDESAVSEAKRRLGIPEDSRVVGSVTRLFEMKGLRYFIDAAPAVLGAFPNTKFVIVGDGPLRGELEAQVRRLGIGPSVIFTGYLQQVAPVLAAFDVEVVTSIFAEGGSPLPVLEAMAMAKPVVVTEIVEIVEDGVNGFVIPGRNSDALSERLIRILGNNQEARAMGEKGREMAKMYNVQRYMRTLEGIYEEVLAKARALRSA